MISWFFFGEVPINGLAFHLHLLFVLSLSTCHVNVNSYWSALYTFNYSMPHNTIWLSIKAFECLPCSNSPWFPCIIWSNMFCGLTDAFTLPNCSVTFWLIEAWQLLIIVLVLGNAFRCFFGCYRVDQELCKRKTIQQSSWREIWKLECTLICAVTGTLVGVLYCFVNEK